MFQHEVSFVAGRPLAPGVPAITVPQLIRYHARKRADRVALVEAASGRSYTYGELDHLMGRFAAGLAALGFRPGERLVIFMPNLPAWPIAALGTMFAGGTVSGANSMSTSSELAYQLRDANARFVVTTPDLLSRVRDAAAESHEVKIILLGEASQTLCVSSLLTCQDPEPTIASDPDTMAALPYSSGTSGLPKGVILTHRNIVSNVFQFTQAAVWPESAVSLAFLPMYHIYGLTVVLLGGLVAGLQLVTVPGFEPEAFLKALQHYHVTHLAVVPPVLHFLTKHPLVDAYDLSSLQVVGCGAAPLSKKLEGESAIRLKCKVGQGYGMTESSGVIAVSHPDRYREGSSGELLPGTELRVVDPNTSADLELGVRGEIWFRGPQAFKGYLNNPTMTGDTLTQEGWVRTGDVGYIDADGYVFITDRLKELIKVKGFQVAPAELEALLLTHPCVADAAVIGRPDQRHGEVPVAYVVARREMEPDQLKHWVAERISSYKQLGDIVFCKTIPRSPSGKILRRLLRSEDAERAARI